jgi:hypothetical protein
VIWQRPETTGLVSGLSRAVQQANNEFLHMVQGVERGGMRYEGGHFFDFQIIKRGLMVFGEPCIALLTFNGETSSSCLIDKKFLKISC